MKAGSGISANPSAAAEVSKAGLSWNRRSTPYARAPPLSMMADSMRREVSEKSRLRRERGPELGKRLNRMQQPP